MRILQWILALVFASAAGLKLAGLIRGGTDAPLTMFTALPQVYQWAVVIAELVLAIWLVTAWRPRWGAFFTIVILSVFLGAVIVELGKPEPHSCGCLGTMNVGTPQSTLWLTLALDCLLLLMALGIYYKVPSAGCLRKQAKNTPSGIDLAPKA